MALTKSTGRVIEANTITGVALANAAVQDRHIAAGAISVEKMEDDGRADKVETRRVANIAGAVSTITTGNLTASRALVSDSSGKVAVSDVTSTELTLLDGITAGTVTASKALIVDSDKDLTGGRNITITGELDAGSIDVSGNMDIDGITNLDVVSISDTVTMDTNKKILFRDSDIFINSSADGQLDISADTEVQIAATTVDINSNVDISGNVIIGGALKVDGTTTTVNSTTITVDDPIFTLGGDTAPGSDDNKDRGIEFRYHTGSAAKIGFFGFDDSTSKFTFIPDATNSSEVFSGTTGGIDVNAVTVNGLTASRAIQTDSSKNLESSAVTTTELGYVSGVTSAIQTQLDALAARKAFIFFSNTNTSTSTSNVFFIGKEVHTLANVLTVAIDGVVQRATTDYIFHNANDTIQITDETLPAGLFVDITVASAGT